MVVVNKCCMDFKHHHGTSACLVPQPHKALASECERKMKERWKMSAAAIFTLSVRYQ